jgi:hypothetical protein
MNNGELLIRQPGEIVTQREPTFLEIIQASIANPQVDVAKIDALLQMRERLEARDAEKEYNRDFAAAMMEMPKVAKRGKKDMKEKGCIAYETYEDLDAAIRPIETKFGFARSFSTRISEKGGGVILVLTLTHRAGHSTTSERYCPPDPGPGRNETQAIGSGESYGRRYLTKSKWNIVTVGADDDGNSADPISEEQALGIRDILATLAPTPKWYAQFWAWVGGDTHSVEQIQKRDYVRVREELARRLKTAQTGGAR